MIVDLQRNQRQLAIGFWVVWLTVGTVVNASSVLRDFARAGLEVATWEPWVWEGSSHLLFALLIPAVLWFDRRFGFAPGRWRGPLLAHALATVPFSLAHVGGMVALRKLAYQAAGSRYDFGDVPAELLYEFRKDVASYAFIVLVFYAWRRLLRTAGDGGAQVAADAPGIAAGESVVGDPGVGDSGVGESGQPAYFVSRKFGREYVVDPADVVWIEAAGNYVNLHCGEDVFPVRGSMAAMEKSLDARRFVRIHRSAIVDVGRIETIVPLDSGDYTLRLKDGGELRLSRRYRARLKAVFG